MSVGTAAAIAGIAAAGTSIVGGVMKSKAANSAAQLQSDAADRAGQGVTDAVAKVNPAILDAATRGGDQVSATAKEAAGDVNLKSLEARDQVKAGAVAANSLLDPYGQAGDTAAGVLQRGISEGGDFNKTPTLADLQIDPGYAFRQAQGEEALKRNAAARGGVGGGGFQKDLQNFIQGSASQEYQKAFERFETSTQNRFSNVSGVAAGGLAARTKQGNNLIDSDKYGGDVVLDASKFGGSLVTDASKFKAASDIDATNLTSKNVLDAARISGDYLTQGANAQAAGKVASSNAVWDGFGNAANTALGALLSRPARNYVKRPGPETIH